MGGFFGHTSLIMPSLWAIFRLMSNLEQVEEAILKLRPQEQRELRDWLENLLEDRLEMTDAFKEEIAAGKADIQAGRVRVRKP
jgi:hypothetical protein